jgi:hypothetical protein
MAGVMRDRTRNGLVALLLSCVALSGLGAAPGSAQAEQEGFRVETLQAAPAGLAEGITKALQPTGTRLLSGEGKIIAEVWLRKDVSLKANVVEAGYGALAEGTLVGLLNFPQGGSDFRGQAIKSGAYTLRFERIPQDGNHLGAAPESNFLLLCPAAEDQQLDATFNLASLVALSRQASGTNHPAPLMLMTVSLEGESPGIERNDLGHVALRMKTSAKAMTWDEAKEFPLALVLVGKAE